ncbi:MAG: hypothetical protein ACRBB0_27050 [Pelagimonas sp.]|uniref:hypothetical protein n=1 Tax=Pelagimonas sp. TaxID=2073170 RepID=UPI003D6C6C8C
MTTKHEAIVGALHALLVGSLAVTVLRDVELPEECPDAGIANLAPEAPREIGRRLGTGVREIQRSCGLEVVVTGPSDIIRIQRLEAVLEALGLVLVPQCLEQNGVDYVDLGPPEDTEVIPMRGSESLRGAVIRIDLFYETTSNVMETAQ